MSSFSGQCPNLNRNKDITFPDVFTPFQRLKNRMITTTIRQSESCHWGRPMSWIPLLSCRCRTPRLPGGEGGAGGDGVVRRGGLGRGPVPESTHRRRPALGCASHCPASCGPALHGRGRGRACSRPADHRASLSTHLWF